MLPVVPVAKEGEGEEEEEEEEEGELGQWWRQSGRGNWRRQLCEGCRRRRRRRRKKKKEKKKKMERRRRRRRRTSMEAAARGQQEGQWWWCSRAEVPLICYEIVEYHHLERVMRQFARSSDMATGMIQGPPSSSTQIASFA
ncbi:hypothetical protein M9H77_21820 [Catharanthus roseus]|uniref:Uncharacterized protein n=1 Tax=Catharanthus roseus TaxID=4058 RepID=A0ACC0APW8_CATRO|nr:hypothetical protein M9H77_21820 [Catharanthus roseus]